MQSSLDTRIALEIAYSRRWRAHCCVAQARLRLQKWTSK